MRDCAACAAVRLNDDGQPLAEGFLPEVLGADAQDGASVDAAQLGLGTALGHLGLGLHRHADEHAVDAHRHA
eukprot:2325145-Alexandrium_andersonii.AAC.1